MNWLFKTCILGNRKSTIGLKFVLALLLGLLFGGGQINAQKLDLLVVIDDTGPLTVNYLTKADAIAAGLNTSVGGLLPGLILSRTVKSRNEKFSERLQALVGDYGRREQFLRDMLSKSFANETDDISLTFLNITKAEQYRNNEKPNYKSLKKGNWSFVMFVKENAGFTTPASHFGKLVVSSTLSISVYDVDNKKRIFKQPFTSLHHQVYEVDSALTDKTAFITNYPNIHVLGSQIYFRLSGKDVLHQMAKTVGLESEFPSVKSVLNDYKRNFSYKAFIPKGWIKLPSNNDYIFRNAPKKDKAVVGIVSDIDLLIKPLGQYNLNISAFSEMRISRLQDMGFVVTPLDEKLKILDLDEQWNSYMFANNNGGISIMFHNILNKEYTVNHQLILLGDNYLELLEKHKIEIEQYINQSELIVK